MSSHIPDQPLRSVPVASWPASPAQSSRTLALLRLAYEYGVLYGGLLLFGLVTLRRLIKGVPLPAGGAAFIFSPPISAR